MILFRNTFQTSSTDVFYSVDEFTYFLKCRLPAEKVTIVNDFPLGNHGVIFDFSVVPIGDDS